MALEFVFAGSGLGKSTYVQNRMIEDALRNRDKDYYLIVPDQFTMSTQKRMAECNPRGGILNIDVLSFSRLSYRIFSEVGRKNKVTLDDTGKNLLIRRAAATKADSLRVLKKGIGNIGWTSEVKSVLSEFMQYGMSPEEIGKLSDNLKDNDYLKSKINDIRIIYEEFLKECGDAFLTRESVLDELAERIPLSSKLPSTEIVFDGFTGFTPIQYKVITELTKASAKVTITFPFDKVEGPVECCDNHPFRIGDEDYLFLLTQKNVKALQESVQREGIEVLPEIYVRAESDRFAKCPDIAHLEQNLFRGKTAVYGGLAENIELYKADNILDECRGMCHRLTQIIKEHEGSDECRYRDCAVITGNPEVYNPVLKRVLREMGIPSYIDENRSLLMNPFIMFLRSSLKCIKSGFKYEDVMTAVRCGFLDIEREEADMLDNYLRARSVRGFSSFLKEFTSVTSNMSNPEEELTILNDVRERFVDAFAGFENINPTKEYQAVDLMKIIYGFVSGLDIESKLLDKSKEFEEMGEIALAAEYKSVYGKVCELFDQVVSIMGDSPVCFNDLADILEAGYGELKCGILPQGVDVLAVGDMQRSRLNNIKVLFFLGVDDSNIPKALAKGGILSEMDKKTLENANFRLAPSASEQTFIERLYLYLCVTKPSEKLYVSYSTMAPDGKTQRPSYFVREIQSLFTEFKEKTIVCDDICVNLYDIARIVARDLPDYVSGRMNDAKKEVFFDRISMLKGSEEGSRWLAALFASAFAIYEPETLPREIVKELYGNLYTLSVTAVEKYAQCPMAHFLRYGIELKERETGEAGVLDIGNISHSVLEKLLKKVSKEYENIAELSEDEIIKITDDCFDEVIADERMTRNFTSSSEKFFLSFQRDIVRECAVATKRQLESGKFVPELFEHSFTEILKDESGFDGMQIQMYGKIDRVDICRREDDNLVKIVDYKSSSKEISKEEVILGRSLQLEVYMNEACKFLEKSEKKETVPAAMLYVQVDDPVIKLKSADDNIEEARAIKERPTGTVLCDKEVLNLLDVSGEGANKVIPVSYKNGEPVSNKNKCLERADMNELLNIADSKVRDIAGSIVKGEIATSPLEYGSKDACQYCAYKKCCGFDEKIPGYEKRDGDEIVKKALQDNGEGENK